MSEFEFSWVHVPGSSNTLADNLSRIFVDKADEISDLIRFHNESHLGPNFMVSYLDSLNIKWPERNNQIKDICKSCTICNIYNVGKRKFFAPQNIISNYPMFHVQMDLAGPFNLENSDLGYVLILVDVF